jgi:hypothetical protein
MYKLNKKSIFVRFYNWMWLTDATNLKTMCPYSWGYVLTILLLPIALPIRLIYSLLPTENKVEQAFDSIGDSVVWQNVVKPIAKARIWMIIGTGLKWIYFIAIGGFLLGMLVAYIYGLIVNTVVVLAVTGGVALLLAIIVLLVYLFAEKKLGYYLGMPFRFMWSMLVSLYRNWCPLIEWVD